MSRRSTLWSVVWTVVIVVCGWVWVEGRVRLPPAPSAPPYLQLSLADAGSEVHMLRGDLLGIALPSASPMGVRCWIEEPAAPVMEIEQEPARAVRTDRWLLRAARIGQARLRFECHEDLSPASPRQVEYTIRVD